MLEIALAAEALDGPYDLLERGLREVLEIGRGARHGSHLAMHGGHELAPPDVVHRAARPEAGGREPVYQERHTTPRSSAAVSHGMVTVAAVSTCCGCWTEAEIVANGRMVCSPRHWKVTAASA